MPKQLSFQDFINRMNKADDRLLATLHEKLTVIGLKAERQAKLNATDDPKVRTGRLRSSITSLVGAKDGNPQVILRAGGDTGGAPVLYARYVEFGTRYMRPRLFMGRAVKKTHQTAEKELKDVLSIALRAD